MVGLAAAGDDGLPFASMTGGGICPAGLDLGLAGGKRKTGIDFPSLETSEGPAVLAAGAAGAGEGGTTGALMGETGGNLPGADPVIGAGALRTPVASIEGSGPETLIVGVSALRASVDERGTDAGEGDFSAALTGGSGGGLTAALAVTTGAGTAGATGGGLVNGLSEGGDAGVTGALVSPAGLGAPLSAMRWDRVKTSKVCKSSLSGCNSPGSRCFHPSGGLSGSCFSSAGKIDSWEAFSLSERGLSLICVEILGGEAGVGLAASVRLAGRGGGTVLAGGDSAFSPGILGS